MVPHDSLSETTNQPRVILYLEDDDASSYLFQEMIRDCCDLTDPVEVHRVTNVDSALAFLNHNEPYSSAPRPNVIILDINVPGSSGFSVLKAIRNDPHFASLPVIMFSSSVAAADLERARVLGADNYLVKLDLASFVNAAKMALQFATTGTCAHDTPKLA